ncbi:MAG: hypothetical protein IJ387_08815 [Thermoguttaceae bacterium]|nr:hypothetical protein [Thermoguttaceae bacterium]
MKINWTALEIELLKEQTKAAAALVRTTKLLEWLDKRDDRGEPGATFSYRSTAFDAELGFENAYALGKYAAQANARARKVAEFATATEAPEYVERVRVLRLLSLLSSARVIAGRDPVTFTEIPEQIDAGIIELAAKFAQDVGAADEDAARLAVEVDVYATDDLF